ncbi:Pc16g06040 [Penicillium rubens Wisconsin 54-1255]|jgi:hypothetical protein|uniref:Pc16g06040 protein n=2 Tax=Penicillium chrysogenum species complex TaxID=254878 RepID=B6H8I7_PENRW|nr:Pc16g06040 [Penicillium rubens Wisconsin 54-1255]
MSLSITQSERAKHPFASNPSIMKSWDYGKLAIATASILGILTFGALIYLLMWYVRRSLRARRLRRQEDQQNDQFNQSNVSLAEDTSRTLDDFLMKDIQPERNSISFSRSGSPSITIVIDDADDADRDKSPPQPYPTEHYTAASSSANTYTSTPFSSQESDPDDPRSDQTEWSSSGQRSSSTTPRASTSSSVVPTSPRSSQNWTTTSASTPMDQTQTSSSGQRSSSSTPRASISSVVPTVGSSQDWATTSAPTETVSLLSRSSKHPRSPQSPTSPAASPGSQLYTRRSNASVSSAGILQSASRMFNEAEASRMAYSRNIDSVGSRTPTSPVSPVLVDVSAESDRPQWTPVPPTPFPPSQL